MGFRSFFNRFPYTDFHELNLDFILGKIGAIDGAVAKVEEVQELIDQAGAIVDEVETAAAGAETAKTGAEAARSAAVTAQTAAAGSAANAAASATAAQNAYNQLIADDRTFLKRATDRKWFCFADSYGAFDDSYTVRLKTILGDAFDYKAQSGMRYNMTAMTDRYSFSSMLDSWLPGISDKDSYTDVLVELGVNDMDGFAYDSIMTGFKQSMAKVHSAFPNAHIHCGVFAKNMIAPKWSTYTRVISLIKLLAGELGPWCSWVDGNDRIMAGHDDTIDLLHPNTTMSVTLARYIMSYMGTYNLPTRLEPERSTIFARGGKNLTISEEYSDGTYTIYARGEVGGGMDLPADGSLISLGNVNLPMIHRSVSVTGWISTKLDYLGTDFRLNIPATLLFIPRDSDGVTQLYLCASYTSFYRDSSGNAQPWQSGMRIDSFSFSGAQVSIPA